MSTQGSATGSFDFPSPRILNAAVPVSPAFAHNNSRTLSDVDHAEFASAASRTASEADFLSAIGDEDFDVMSGSTRSNASSVLGDEFDSGDNASEAESWASISQPRR
jgi:hypothetical protein